MAASETGGEQDGGFAAGRPGFSYVSTTNIINPGQVIQVSGQNATVILSDNRVGVVQGNVGGSQATSSTHSRPPHPPHTPQPSTSPTTAVANALTTEIRYATGTLPHPFFSTFLLFPLHSLPYKVPNSSSFFSSPPFSPPPYSRTLKALQSPWSC